MKNFNLRIVYSLLFFVVLGFSFASCKDDKEPEVKDKNPIVGSWKLAGISPEKTGTTIPQLSLITSIPCIPDLVFTFQDNNKFTPSGCDAAVTLMQAFIAIGPETKWNVANNKLSLENGTSKQEFAITQGTNDLSIIIPTNPTNADLNVKLTLTRSL